jgi:hypothetical protein
MMHSENLVICENWALRGKMLACWSARGKFWRCAEKYGVLVRTLNLAWSSVHTHKKVHAMYTHIVMVCMVCTVLAECRGLWLVRAQYGYMLSCDNLVNGAHIVFVRDGAYRTWHGVVHRVKCAWNINARYKNYVK